MTDLANDKCCHSRAGGNMNDADYRRIVISGPGLNPGGQLWLSISDPELNSGQRFKENKQV